jgi:hypothetical protein
MCIVAGIVILSLALLAIEVRNDLKYPNRKRTTFNK